MRLLYQVVLLLLSFVAGYEKFRLGHNGRRRSLTMTESPSENAGAVNPMFCGVNNGPKKEKRRREVTNLRQAVREREWVSREGHSSLADTDAFCGGPGQASSTVKIVTYNVLGPLHGESSKHDYAAEAVTRWTRRRDKLIEELIDLEADILCLQEVSQKALKDTFIPRLLGSGLECTGFAPSKHGTTKSGKYAHKYVGCAIFTRSSKVTLIESKRVHLRDWAPLSECKSNTLRDEMKSHWNCMAMGLFQVKGEGEDKERTGGQIMIGNAHLFWNPNRADVKVLQAAACTQALAKFMDEVRTRREQEGQEESGSEISVILAGDFNTPPTLQQDFDPFLGLGDQEVDIYAGVGLGIEEGRGVETDTSFVGVTGTRSGPFEYLSGGSLDNSHPQHPDNWSLRLGEKGLPNPQMGPLVCPLPGLKHPFIEIAAFRAFQPLFTTRTDEFSGWIDHMWCSDDVDVAAVMVPPVRAGDLEAGLKSRGFLPIPSKEYPSDHLPLGIMIRL